jgi:hypothetical protein
VQLGHSYCISFALPLHACLALYVEPVDERKLVCVWCMEKLLCSQLVPGTNKQFLGLVLTASRLLALWHVPNQPHRPRASTCCLEDVCLLILHCRRLIYISTAIEQFSKDTQYVLDVHRVCHSEAKLATLKFLCR